MEEATDTGGGNPPSAASRIILLDPHGVYTSYSIPQGAANYANTDVRYPVGGTWTAILAVSTGVVPFTGPTSWAVQVQDYITHGSVSPASFTLAPGASRTVTVHTSTL